MEPRSDRREDFSLQKHIRRHPLGEPWALQAAGHMSQHLPWPSFNVCVVGIRETLLQTGLGVSGFSVVWIPEDSGAKTQIYSWAGIPAQASLRRAGFSEIPCLQVCTPLLKETKQNSVHKLVTHGVFVETPDMSSALLGVPSPSTELTLHFKISSPFCLHLLRVA